MLKNWQGDAKEFTKDMLADYYLFLDVDNLRMCVVPNSFIQVKQAKTANVMASCDPLPKHFVKLPKVEGVGSFFQAKEQWVESFLQSV